MRIPKAIAPKAGRIVQKRYKKENAARCILFFIAAAPKRGCVPRDMCSACCARTPQSVGAGGCEKEEKTVPEKACQRGLISVEQPGEDGALAFA